MAERTVQNLNENRINHLFEIIDQIFLDIVEISSEADDGQILKKRAVISRRQNEYEISKKIRILVDNRAELKVDRVVI